MSLADALVELQELTERLRRECPWDREQTARTIVPHTVEEAYEVADAALAGDDPKLLDEIGDLLFQSYFLALLLSERGAGDLESAARGIHAKLVASSARLRRRRGPHRLAGARPLGGDQARGRGPRGHLPRRAGRAARASLRTQGAAAREVRRLRDPDLAGALADFEDELRELREELPADDPEPETEPAERVAAELGDVLFAAVNVARRLNVDPELELRAAAKRFRSRVEQAEALATADGKNWTELPLDEQDDYYDQAKGEVQREDR